MTEDYRICAKHDTRTPIILVCKICKDVARTKNIGYIGARSIFGGDGSRLKTMEELVAWLQHPCDHEYEHICSGKHEDAEFPFTLGSIQPSKNV